MTKESHISKLQDAGYKLGEFWSTDCVTLACVAWTESIYKHKIHQTYNQDFEAYILDDER